MKIEFGIFKVIVGFQLIILTFNLYAKLNKWICNLHVSKLMKFQVMEFH